MMSAGPKAAHAQASTRHYPCSLDNAAVAQQGATELVIRELAPVVAPIIWPPLPPKSQSCDL